jgi:GntR family transcriptional regulator, transcriptional repressor for pyruvate dehydrogenase complex
MILNDIAMRADPAGVSNIIAAIQQLRENGGELPSERELAGQLQIKRHQLRKALDRMRQSGDLKPARTRRAATTQPRYGEELVRLTNPLEVIELRLMLEPGFARLASLRASALETAHILQWATTQADAKPEEADLNFHLAIATAARNHLARELFVMLRRVGVDARMRVARGTPSTCPNRIAQRDSEHRRIAEAITGRDPEAAEEAMRSHLLLVQRRIMERSNSGLAAA